MNVKEFFDEFAAMCVISRRCSGRITHVIYFGSNLVHHNELVDNELICKVMRTVKKVNSELERAWDEIDAMGACDSDGYGYVDMDEGGDVDEDDFI